MSTVRLEVADEKQAALAAVLLRARPKHVTFFRQPEGIPGGGGVRYAQRV